MDNQTIYNEIISKLKATRRKETVLMLSSALMKSLGIFALVILLISIIELIADGDIAFRTFLAGFSMLSLVLSLAYFLFPVYRRVYISKYHPSLYDIALRVGNFYPDLKDNLCNGIQLLPIANNPKGASKDLIYAAFAQIAESSRNKDFDVIIEKKNFGKILIFFFAALIITGASMFMSSSLHYAFYRVANWNQSFLPPPPYTISITPLNQDALRGSAVKIIVKASGEAPETITLNIKEGIQENYDKYVLRLDSANIYTYEISSLKNSLMFFAESKWLSSTITTEIGKINLIDRPLIKSLSGKLKYPSYTGFAPKQFDEQSADLSALSGSSVELSLLSNKSLKSASIVYYKAKFSKDSTLRDSSIIPMNIDDSKASGSFRINQTGSYKIVLLDKDNQTNVDPIEYSILVNEDGSPSIMLLSPNMDVEVGKDLLLPIKVAIADDYGFSSLKLFYRLTASKYGQPQKNFKSINIPIVSKELAQELPYIWDLSSIDITPDDKYEFYLEVADNDNINGPKKSRTGSINVKLPSDDEVLNESEKVQEKIQKDLQKTLKEAETVKKQMEELNRELLKKENPQLDWKQKKQAEDIMKKQNEIKEKLNQIQKELQQNTQKLQQNNLLSQETLQKYMQLQKLMQEVKSPELERMQRMMEQAMQNLSQEQLQKAMQEVKFDEERFRKSIERTMKILKRIQLEQKADALAKRSEEMEKKLEDLEKQLNNSNPNDKDKKESLAKSQERMKDDLKSMKDDLKDLEKMMKEFGESEMPMKELDEAKESMANQDPSEDMQDAQDDIEKGDFQKAQQSQRSAQKKMKNFSQKMKSLKQKMQEKNSKEAMRKMQKAINDLLELSKDQEQLKNKTQKSDFNSTQIPNFAQEQAAAYDALMNVANSMMELGEKSFAVTPEMGAQIGQALRQMRNAINQLSERRTPNAASAQQDAMQAMNNAIGQMQTMLQTMQKNNGACENPGGMGQGQSQGNSSGMGFQQRLQQMAAEQQALNQSLQQMSQGQGSGKMNQEQQAQMGRLADKQGKAQKSMQELAEEQKQFGNQGDKKSLGDLEKIAQEMKEVASDMKSGNVTPETLKRQEKILSRLLDATKSLNDRDFEKDRQANSGKDYNRKSPNSLDLNSVEGKSKAIQDLLRSIKQGYTKDYEQLIRKYFEALQSMPISN